MNVLLLSPYPDRILQFLANDDVTVTDKIIDENFLLNIGCEQVISYGYRHKITKATIDAVNGMAFNLHTSLLPWNRGADPNFWSWIENSPKGVSIHLISEIIDRGPILTQREVGISEHETLSSSYEILQSEIAELFGSFWLSKSRNSTVATPQIDGGTYHKSDGIDRFRELLSQGHETRCSEIKRYGQLHGLWVNG